MRCEDADLEAGDSSSWTQKKPFGVVSQPEELSATAELLKFCSICRYFRSATGVLEVGGEYVTPCVNLRRQATYLQAFYRLEQESTCRHIPLNGAPVIVKIVVG